MRLKDTFRTNYYRFMRNRLSMAICLLLGTSAIFFSAYVAKKVKSADSDPVKIESGLISGVKSDAGDVIAFKGIPFAAPPVGDLRWKAPQPAQAWNDVKKCDALGPSPMQGKPVPFMVYTPEFLIPESPISEDCLYLNVWTKAKKNDKKPVLVWIYGGGFRSGGAGVPIYDGEAMAKKGIIFVSVNYRVGVFGFLAHPELTKESPDHASGNYGLLDQIAALKWVKKNIAAFGGDPDNVTIDGQSAGSMSVNCLVASPVAKGLFNHAISESGSYLIAHPDINTNTLSSAEQQGVKLQEAVNAKSLKELRNVAAADLMKVNGNYGPIIDGYVLPEAVDQLFAKGKQNDVPVITGWNHDDALIGSFKTKEAFIQQAKDQYGADADTFLKYYPASTDEEAKRSQINLSRDRTFAMSGYQWGKIQSRQGKSPIYIYNFNRRLPATADYVKYGAFHTGEVAYVFDDLKFLNRPWEPADHELASMMSDYWVNFITTGDPNGGALPAWPKFNADTHEAMVFDKASGKQPLPDKAELDFMLSRLGK